MLGLFLSPAILWLILLIVARKQGDTSYVTLFFVSLGVAVISTIAAIYVPQFCLVITLIVCVLALRRFCYIGWTRAIIATVLYIGWLVAWPILFDRLAR